ncbi:MAG: hypothetical protein OXF11_15690 [Deltaproteobacteria bacterium]|nr:hypothetical protein [Deltaproteobacteria bacterium]
MKGRILAFAGILLLMSPAYAQGGSFTLLLTGTHAYTTIEHSTGRMFAGGVDGVATVTESTGEPFAKGMSFYMTCVANGTRSDAGLQLETSCVGTDTADDRARLYMSGGRGKGTTKAGGGGAGMIEIVGGAGRFAELKGSCPYDTAYLKGDRVVTSAKCTWEKASAGG